MRKWLEAAAELRGRWRDIVIATQRRKAAMIRSTPPNKLERHQRLETGGMLANSNNQHDSEHGESSSEHGESSSENNKGNDNSNDSGNGGDGNGSNYSKVTTAYSCNLLPFSVKSEVLAPRREIWAWAAGITSIKNLTCQLVNS